MRGPSVFSKRAGSRAPVGAQDAGRDQRVVSRRRERGAIRGRRHAVRTREARCERADALQADREADVDDRAVGVPQERGGALQLSLTRRAALDQFWTTQNDTALGLTTVGSAPRLLKSDGADIWVANFSGASVSRVRASDGKSLETWTGATSAGGVLVAPASGEKPVIIPVKPGMMVTLVADGLISLGANNGRFRSNTPGGFTDREREGRRFLMSENSGVTP